MKSASIARPPSSLVLRRILEELAIHGGTPATTLRQQLELESGSIEDVHIDALVHQNLIQGFDCKHLESHTGPCPICHRAALLRDDIVYYLAHRIAPFVHGFFQFLRSKVMADEISREIEMPFAVLAAARSETAFDQNVVIAKRADAYQFIFGHSYEIALRLYWGTCECWEPEHVSRLIGNRANMIDGAASLLNQIDQWSDARLRPSADIVEKAFNANPRSQSCRCMHQHRLSAWEVQKSLNSFLGKAVVGVEVGHSQNLRALARNNGCHVRACAYAMLPHLFASEYSGARLNVVPIVRCQVCGWEVNLKNQCDCSDNPRKCEDTFPTIREMTDWWALDDTRASLKGAKFPVQLYECQNCERQFFSVHPDSTKTVSLPPTADHAAPDQQPPRAECPRCTKPMNKSSLEVYVKLNRLANDDNCRMIDDHYGALAEIQPGVQMGEPSINRNVIDAAILARLVFDCGDFQKIKTLVVRLGLDLPEIPPNKYTESMLVRADVLHPKLDGLIAAKNRNDELAAEQIALRASSIRKKENESKIDWDKRERSEVQEWHGKQRQLEDQRQQISNDLSAMMTDVSTELDQLFSRPGKGKDGKKLGEFFDTLDQWVMAQLGHWVKSQTYKNLNGVLRGGIHNELDPERG